MIALERDFWHFSEMCSRPEILEGEFGDFLEICSKPEIFALVFCVFLQFLAFVQSIHAWPGGMSGAFE